MQIQSKELFSKLAIQMNDSSVSEILKVIQKSSVISLAGGMPDPKTFPVEEFKKICAKILNNDSAMALQYSSTEGYIKLREFLSHWLNLNRDFFSKDNIIISSGSQQGLDLVSKVLLNPGDVVIVELPSYLAALNSFRSYGAEIIGIPMDSEGIQLDFLENTLNELSKMGKAIKFIYTISNFQNPAGVTVSLPRRKKILEIAMHYDLFILEDDPYGKLRFEGDPIPSISSFDHEGRVISLGTFSKILCPGLRLAWIVGNKEIIEKMIILKGATDVCTPMLNQLMAYEFCLEGNLDKNIQSNISVYKKKKDIMLRSLEKYFPTETSWTKPEGGFFVFVTLPDYIDANQMFYESIEENVAYVSGSTFYANGKGQNTLRLSFSYPKEEDINEGIKRLGRVIARRIKK